jgi:hypothetical protein
MILSDKPADAPNWRTVYGAPILIGLLSLAGLVSALLFGELGRYFYMIAVGCPILLIKVLFAKRWRRRSRAPATAHFKRRSEGYSSAPTPGDKARCELTPRAARRRSG